MAVNRSILKTILTIVLVFGLFAFSHHRADQRNVSEMDIEFTGKDKLFITQAAVNKLLIQNYGPLENLSKDEVVLDSLEETILANDMVKSAQVYHTVNGQLKSIIEQRTPIGRIQGTNRYYLDDEGKAMPLSPYYAARVPIITGSVTNGSLTQIYELLQFINQDDFLRKNLIGVHVTTDFRYQLRLRTDDFTVVLGTVENLPQKFANFKAFYAKASKDKVLERYSTVSLEFENQVVCTKK